MCTVMYVCVRCDYDSNIFKETYAIASSKLLDASSTVMQAAYRFGARNVFRGRKLGSFPRSRAAWAWFTSCNCHFASFSASGSWACSSLADLSSCASRLGTPISSLCTPKWSAASSATSRLSCSSMCCSGEHSSMRSQTPSCVAFGDSFSLKVQRAHNSTPVVVLKAVRNVVRLQKYTVYVLSYNCLCSLQQLSMFFPTTVYV